MLLNKINVWCGIDVIIIRENKRVTAKCRVADYDGESILVTTPLLDGHPIKLEENENVTIISTVNGVMEWKCKCEGLVHVGNVILHKISCDKPGSMINRRSCFRLTLYEKIKIRTSHAKEPVDGIIKDISYEGIGINTSEEIKIGDTVSFILLWEGHKIGIRAQIIRKLNVNDGNYKYNYGGIMEDIDKSAVSKLINDLQIRELRRKSK